MKKSTKLTIYSILYTLLSIALILLVVYKKHSEIFMTLLVMTIIILLSIALFAGFNRMKVAEVKKAETKENEVQIRKFIKKNSEFKLDQSRYLKKIKMEDSVILETVNWNTFTPKLGKKSGITLFNHFQVIKYLKKCKYSKRK